jgi:CrcB protein
MKELALVFVGGGLGSIVRFLLGRWVNTLHQLNFPLGTLVVNVVACFILGLIVGLADHRHVLSADMRLFLTVGFCGGFSTFSAFSYETLLLFQQPNVISGMLYIVMSVALCLGAVMVGMVVGR